MGSPAWDRIRPAIRNPGLITSQHKRPSVFAMLGWNALRVASVGRIKVHPD